LLLPSLNRAFLEKLMKSITLSAASVLFSVVSLAAAPSGLTGTYVEARTSEVFAGACVVNSEAGTTGREALLAWKVDQGQFDGVRLDGLTVVAAVAGDTNLSVHEIGGDVAKTRAVMFTDARATTAQRQALTAMARHLSKGLVGNVVEATPTAIQFVNGAHEIRVTADSVRLVVDKHLDHDVTCGNKQWFAPLASVKDPVMGAAVENAFTGRSLGTRWSDPNKRSAFHGTFSY
jgi:hypothetical protein